MSISDNIREITNGLPKGVRLVAISKYHPIASIEEAYIAGQRIFGESHVQELQEKVKSLPQDIEWHFIGHLQTNKVKYIAPYISLIHSVDTEKLLTEINKQGEKINRIIPILLQIHIAEEETKFGFTIAECEELLNKELSRLYPFVTVCGLMCMASNTECETQIEKEFQTVRAFFNKISEQKNTEYPNFRELSMGMSHDYPLAVNNGSTLVRVGSKIFGERDYSLH